MVDIYSDGCGCDVVADLLRMPQRPRTFHNSEYENFELSYPKLSDDAALSMVTKSMDFTVCPHAHYYYDTSATACKNYVTHSVRLSCVCGMHACGLI